MTEVTIKALVADAICATMPLWIGYPNAANVDLYNRFSVMRTDIGGNNPIYDALRDAIYKQLGFRETSSG